jgi:hypothetical protein
MNVFETLGLAIALSVILVVAVDAVIVQSHELRQSWRERKAKRG